MKVWAVHHRSGLGYEVRLEEWAGTLRINWATLPATTVELARALIPCGLMRLPAKKKNPRGLIEVWLAPTEIAARRAA